MNLFFAHATFTLAFVSFSPLLCCADSPQQLTQARKQGHPKNACCGLFRLFPAFPPGLPATAVGFLFTLSLVESSRHGPSEASVVRVCERRAVFGSCRKHLM